MSLMLDEIFEQPVVLEQTIKNESEKIKKIGEFLRSKDIDLIVIAARGSSDNASLFGRYLLEITTGIPVSLVRAVGLHALRCQDKSFPRSGHRCFAIRRRRGHQSGFGKMQKIPARSHSELPTKKILRWRKLPMKLC